MGVPHKLNLYSQVMREIRLRQKELGMTDAKLARRMGFSSVVYLRYVLDEKQHTTVKNLLKMIRILGLDLKVSRATAKERDDR